MDRHLLFDNYIIRNRILMVSINVLTKLTASYTICNWQNYVSEKPSGKLIIGDYSTNIINIIIS